MRIPELVVPAGTPDKLKIALEFGADAVYLSGKQFGLRYYAGNFETSEIEDAVNLVHSYGKKAYLAVNSICRNCQIKELREFFDQIVDIEVDAFIISDPGVIKIASEICPSIPVHLSTQVNTTNIESVRFWEQQGVKRIILARELSADEIREIADESSAELEIFVHGALCMAFAGKCYLSLYMDDRESNQGKCSHICRREYFVAEKKDSDDFYPVDVDKDNMYIFNSRDLCLIEYLPDICDMNIHAVKIEGRMKSILYLASIIRIYRCALDRIKNNQPIFKYLIKDWKKELAKVSHRGYTTGFYGNDDMDNRFELDGNYIQDYQFLGIIEDVSNSLMFVINPKSQICVGDNIELVCSDCTKDRVVRVEKILRNGELCESANPNQESEIFVNGIVNKGEILRKKR